ncbi:hypothetical protein M9Y10_009266 [Tritrichomonas musculus]|uniref:DUF4201 domain-containing protein n=1 Tax=Tritrichomonas musculus TaxID=1915356 RepID=A0ABR2IQC9_9EUKA
MSFEIDDLADDNYSYPFLPIQNDPNENDEQEIETLQNQIEEMNSFLQTVHLHSDDRQQRYINAIDKLKKSIEDEKVKLALALEKQIESQNAEIQEILASQENEINYFLSGAQAIENDSKNWQTISNDLNSLGNNIEKIELQKSINRVQGESNDLEFTRFTQTQDRKTLRKHILQTQERKIKSLQDEINRYKSMQRQEDSQFADFLNDNAISQESSEKTQKVLVERMNYEMKQREDIFNSHLKVVQQQINKENQKTENDNRLTKETLDSLLNLRKSTSQRCMKQLSETTYDINRIQHLLEKQNEAEESKTQMTTSSYSKTQNLQRQNALLKQKISQVASEIELIQVNLKKCSLELKRSQTPRKSDQYQLGAKKSLFYSTS